MATRKAGAILRAGRAVPVAAAALATGPTPDDASRAALAAAVDHGAQDIGTAAERSEAKQLTWTEATPGHWLTRPVLIRVATETGEIVLGVPRPDGGGPVLRPMLWQWRGHPVLPITGNADRPAGHLP